MYKLICGAEVTSYMNGEKLNDVPPTTKTLGEVQCDTLEEARDMAYLMICAVYANTLSNGLYEFQPPKTYDNGAYCINMIKKMVLGRMVEYRIVTEVAIVKE